MIDNVWAVRILMPRQLDALFLCGRRSADYAVDRIRDGKHFRPIHLLPPSVNSAILLWTGTFVPSAPIQVSEYLPGRIDMEEAYQYILLWVLGKLLIYTGDQVVLFQLVRLISIRRTIALRLGNELLVEPVGQNDVPAFFDGGCYLFRRRKGAGKCVRVAETDGYMPVCG